MGSMTAALYWGAQHRRYRQSDPQTMFVQGIRGAVDVTRTGAIGRLNVCSQFQTKKATLGSTESNSITDQLDIREQSNTLDFIPVKHIDSRCCLVLPSR
jgi:NH3-dependent NAD+ synthetase